MSEPIFVLGCHRSGTSVVAGLLYHACGVSMGELMPPTEDNPMGYFEAQGVVDAHRDLLGQMERDWTCPPSTFEPSELNLSALEEQVRIHQKLPGIWAMKDPRSMFLLPAWAHLDVGPVRLIAVARPPADTVRSIEKRDRIRQDRAEAIVEAHLRRLAEIADQIQLPVVYFPGDADTLIAQVRELAASLDLSWDEEAARAFFDDKLVRHRSPLLDSSPAYDLLVQRARHPERVPATDLGSLKLTSEPEWPLETHLGTRYGRHRNHLWELARFSANPELEVVEVLREGARLGGKSRPGVTTLHQIEAKGPMAVGATIMRERLRPQAVIAHGLLDGSSPTEIGLFFRSLYINSTSLAEILIDVPDPRGMGTTSVRPPPINNPRPARVQEIATQCGWDHVVTERLSPGRSGMMFRKRILTDHELIPVVTDLIANIERIHTIEKRLALFEGAFEPERTALDRHTGPELSAEERLSLETERKRADEAERALNRLRNRRSVKLALALARPTRGVFRAVRSWKTKG
jgi:hypothetical protein